MAKKLKLVFKDLTEDYLEICDLKLINCEKIIVKNDDILLTKSLLSQNISSLDYLNYPFLKKENIYLFLSTSKKYSSLDSLNSIEEKFSNKEVTNQFKISYTDNVEIDIDYEKKHIIFNFLNPSGRVKIFGNLVDSWSFKLDGENFIRNNQGSKNEYPENKLTGCVTFIDIKVKNIKIESNYSLCEDSFNFIRSSGNVLKADIKNSFSDGLDLDFSNLIIKDLYINNSKNDCIDFSYGIYQVFKFNN